MKVVRPAGSLSRPLSHGEMHLLAHYVLSILGGGQQLVILDRLKLFKISKIQARQSLRGQGAQLPVSAASAA